MSLAAVIAKLALIRGRALGKLPWQTGGAAVVCPTAPQPCLPPSALIIKP